MEVTLTLPGTSSQDKVFQQILVSLTSLVMEKPYLLAQQLAKMEKHSIFINAMEIKFILQQYFKFKTRSPKMDQLKVALQYMLIS